jgi:hypothetical protein
LVTHTKVEKNNKENLLPKKMEKMSIFIRRAWLIGCHKIAQIITNIIRPKKQDKYFKFK